jgi:hypothetical protein
LFGSHTVNHIDYYTALTYRSSGASGGRNPSVPPVAFAPDNGKERIS